MPKPAALRLDASLPKAHTSVLTRTRTGKICLAAFLHHCRVPGFESPACPCGWQWETAKDVILQCQRFAGERRVLRQLTLTTNFQQLSWPRGSYVWAFSPSFPGPGISSPPPPPPPPA